MLIIKLVSVTLTTVAWLPHIVTKFFYISDLLNREPVMVNFEPPAKDEKMLFAERLGSKI